MKIVPVDKEILSEVPKILNILGAVYGEECPEIHLFATLDEDRLGFIARVNELCTFIDSKGECTYFRVGEDDRLITVKKDNYTINFDDKPFLVGDNGIEYTLDIVPIEEDEDEYNGYVTFKQYDMKKDILCDIHFQHMYREIDGIPRIYPYHTQEIDCIFINEDFEKKGALKYGRLPKSCKYYGRIKFDSEELGYKMMAIHDYGIEEVLRQGAVNLLRENPATRYVRITKLRRSGDFGDDWPFGEQVMPKVIDEMLESYGFTKEIPPLLMNLHNGQEPLIAFLNNLAQEMGRVKKIYLEQGNTDLCMKLKLIPDEKN